MPGKMVVPAQSFAVRFSRNSSFTRRGLKKLSEKGLWRSSPSVRGELMNETPEKTSLQGGLYAAQCAWPFPLDFWRTRTECRRLGRTDGKQDKRDRIHYDY